MQERTTRKVYGMSQSRVWTVMVLVLLPIVAIAWRLINLQVVHAASFRAKAEAQQSRQFEIPAQRGEIFLQDNGELYPVALNNSLKYLYADPGLIKDPKDVAQKLAPVLGVDQVQLASQLATKTRYVELKQQISREMAKKIAELRLTGLVLRERDYRYYPEANLMSHILGYVNADGKGQYGVEQYLDKSLAGTNGELKAVTDSQGTPISTQDNIVQEPKNGTSVVLTIDRYIQSIAQIALKNAIENNHAPSGSIIVMEPKTGAIKALVNYPDYDPNNYSKVKASDYASFVNSSISNQFEPGSGFKPLTMSIGLESGKVKANTTFNDTGEVQVGEYTIYNAEKHKFGQVDMSLVIKNSINTGMVYILKLLGGNPNQITRAGKEALHNGILKFGFGKPTGVELANEAGGKVKDPNAADIDYANMTFGQGIATTSLQMVSAVSAIANGGTLTTPYIVDKTVKPDGSLADVQHNNRNNQVMSTQTASDVAAMMVKVVEGGSGYLTRIPGYKIAGKTGTAQVPRADGKGYEDNKNIGSFVGFAPVDDPKFIMLVRIDYPQTNTFAERSAVPAFAEVAKQLFQYYNIPPQN